MYCIAVHFHICIASLNSDKMSAEYQPNLSFVSQIPAEFLKLREYSANPDISWIFFIIQPKFKKKFGWGVWQWYKQDQNIKTKVRQFKAE